MVDAETCMWYIDGACAIGKKKSKWKCVTHVTKYTCSLYKPDFTKLMEGAINENVTNC